MAEDIKTRVAQKLKESGGLSSRDVATYTGPERKKPAADPMNVSSTVNKLPKDAQHDPAIAAGESPSSGEQLADDISRTAAPPAPELMALEEPIEITPDDKRRFLESVITGTRFVRPFSIFGGKVVGKIRSRTARESHALMSELRRQYLAGEIAGDIDYGDRQRWAALRFQLQEVNGEEYPTPQEPLLAQKGTAGEGDQAKPTVKPPKWVEEAVVLFSKNESEAFVAAVYREVNKFEKIYWALVEHASDQAFWQTEGATSA